MIIPINVIFTDHLVKIKVHFKSFIDAARETEGMCDQIAAIRYGWGMEP